MMIQNTLRLWRIAVPRVAVPTAAIMQKTR